MQSVFDRHSITRNRQRALRQGGSDAGFLLNKVGAELLDRLAMVERNFVTATVTSGNAGLLDRELFDGNRHEGLRSVILQRPETWATADEEMPWHGEPANDLALSLLTLHETNDTPGALIHIRKRLKPDGLFMGVMPGSGTLTELRESWLAAETELTGGAFPHVYPFADVRAVGRLLQRAGFALPVVDEEQVTVRYPDMFALMRDLRAMGAMNALINRSRSLTKRRVLLRAAEIYQQRFGDPDGRIPASFCFIYLSGWAPDASQQKPARRGSATVSLADALRQV